MRSSLIMGTVILLGLQAQAGTLIPAKTIQLDPDSSINLADYKANVSISCSRQTSGIFSWGWSQTEDCGSYSADLAISSDGKLTFPEVDDFAHVGGDQLSNMQMAILFTSKSNPKMSTMINVFGADEFALFNSEQAKLKLLMLQPATIEIGLNGSNIAGSAIAQNPGASLIVESMALPKQGVVARLLGSSSSMFTVSYYNDPKMGGATLSSFVNLQTPSGPLAYFEDDVPSFNIFAELSVSNGPGQGQTNYQGSATYSADADGLATVKVINMTLHTN